MSTDTTDEEGDVALAGEYALGLLSAEDAIAFEARLARDPVLRRRVAEWHEGLVTLTDRVMPVAPPAQIKARVDALLFPRAARGRRRRVSLGRLIFGGLAGVVGLLAFAILLPVFSPPAPGLAYQAQIDASDAGLRVLASLDPVTGSLTVTRQQGGPGPGRSLELWLIAPNAAGPVSLGVIDDAETTLTVPEPLRPGFDGGTLAISDEPQGGSPSGAPTSVLAAGPVTRL